MRATGAHVSTEDSNTEAARESERRRPCGARKIRGAEHSRRLKGPLALGRVVQPASEIRLHEIVV